MKRFLKPKLVLTTVSLAMVAAALIGAMLASNIGAHAAGSSSHAEILTKARLLNDGVGFIDVPVAYTCKGAPGTGHAVVTATQTASQSGAGVAASGTSNTFPLNCDGKLHTVGIDVNPGPFPGFNVGKATANVTLTAPSGTAKDTETIKIAA